MDLEDAGTPMKFMLHDHDASFTAAFDAVFQAVGVRVIRSAVQAPRMNSIMERWVGSCRRELLDRTLVWNRRHQARPGRRWSRSATHTGPTGCRTMRHNAGPERLPWQARSCAGWLGCVAGGDGQAGQPPFGHPAGQAAGGASLGAQQADGVVGEDAVWAAAVGDDLGP
jgi:hypothetical protein